VLFRATGKTILDVGANNGNFAVDFSMLVGEEGKVHCFEPQRIVYYQLCANVFINGLSNVHCHHVAVGGSVGTVKIGVPDYFAQGPVNFGDVRVSTEGEDTKLIPLDSMEYEDVVVIKMDVQGYESYVIDGAVETIKKHRPYLFIELEDHLLKEMGTSEKELIDKIEALDYKVIRFQEGLPFYTVSGKCIDWVGIPNEKNPENYIIP